MFQADGHARVPILYSSAAYAATPDWAGLKPAPTFCLFPSKTFEISFGVETQFLQVANHLGFGVRERLVHHVLRDVEVFEVQRVRDADEAGLLRRDAPVAADGRSEGLLVASQ